MKKTRSRFIFPTNKYQRKILLITFLPSLFFLSLLTLLLLIFEQNITNVILYSSDAEVVHKISQWSTLIVGAACITIFSLVLIIYSISLSLVGAFERIIRELDSIIAGEKTGPITARKNDDLPNELLKRINKLIQRRS